MCASQHCPKDYVSSLLADIVTPCEMPYRLGDWITVEGVDGEVKSIGMRALEIVTPDDTVTAQVLGDADAHVRAEAAQVVGGMGEMAGRAQLETMVVSDPDPVVRRNAAWALGKLAQASSREALTTATADKSGLVRMVARASLKTLR